MRNKIFLFIFLIIGVSIQIMNHMKSVRTELAVDIAFLLLWLSPYVVITTYYFLSNKKIGAVTALALVVIFDIYNHLEVFYYPSSSTAGLGMLIIPIWNLGAVLPLGVILGEYMYSKLSNK